MFMGGGGHTYTIVTFLVGLFGMDSVLPDGLILNLRIIALLTLHKSYYKYHKYNAP